MYFESIVDYLCEKDKKHFVAQTKGAKSYALVMSIQNRKTILEGETSDSGLPGYY
jgi:hypothetical protein